MQETYDEDARDIDILPEEVIFVINCSFSYGLSYFLPLKLLSFSHQYLVRLDFFLMTKLI